MNNRIKNFSKEDSMRTFRVIMTLFLGVLCGVFTYYGIDTVLSTPNLPIIFYAVFFFPTGVTLSCLLAGIFVEEDVPTKSEYIQ